VARLLGSLSLRDLVMADLDRPIAEVMRRKPITAEALEDQESVANKMAKYNLLAIPVLEKDGSVVGFVTVDDVIDVLIEEGTEDILRLAGVEPGALDKPYFDNPVWLVVRKRIGWLLLLSAVPGAVIGGLHQWKTLRDGTPEQCVAETQDAIAQTKGRGLIVGPGCVLPMNTPDANVAAVIKELGGPLKPLPGVQL
jgi:signal-transduction protein with cAMP-binding, CBS, and nucleotidyltransferase domain